MLVQGLESSWARVLSGVPQGSVLGPVLFVCHINDMPDTISSFMYMYADDTKMARVVNEKKRLEGAPTRLEKLTGMVRQMATKI